MSLEHELRSLDVVWPSTPDIAAAISPQLVSEPATPRPRSLLDRRWLRLALPAVIAAVVAAAAVPPVRAAVERLLGIAGGERIERVDRPPRAERRLDLGSPVTLAQARDRAGSDVRLPRSLGTPDGVRLGGDFGAHAVSLLYNEDTVLTEIPNVSAIGAAKQVGRGVRLRPVDVSDAVGIWIARGPRTLIIPGRNGTTSLGRSALPGAGVLLWDRNGVAYRLETRRPLASALRIARSVPR